MHVNRGIGLKKFLQERRQIVQPNTVNSRYPHRPGNKVLDLLQLAFQRLKRLDNLLAVVVKHLTFSREPELFLAAFDQQRLELPLQRTDLLAHRRLRHVIDLRRPRKTLRLRQVTKNLQTLDLHNLANKQTLSAKSNRAATSRKLSAARNPVQSSSASQSHRPRHSSSPRHAPILPRPPKAVPAQPSLPYTRATSDSGTQSRSSPTAAHRPIAFGS